MDVHECQVDLVAMAAATVFIHNSEDLNKFIAEAALSPALRERTETLHIEIPTPVSPISIRKALSLVPTARSLCILLLPTTPATIFTGVHFSGLVTLQTNIFHATIAPFIYRQRSIRWLVLESCGRSKTCPLRFLTTRPLSQLGGPAECVASIMGPYQNTASSLRASPLSTNLYGLELHFSPDDLFFMRLIIRLAPGLSVLTLLERGTNTISRRGTPPGRRVWNDYATWAAYLRQLPSLKKLTIATPAHIVPHPGCLSEEKQLIERWLSGRRTGRLDSRHPSLKRISLWYRKTGLRKGYVGVWIFEDGIWYRKLAYGPNVPPSFFV